MAPQAHSQSLRVQPELTFELRAFPEDPQFDEQFEHLQPSAILTGTARWTSRDRRQRFVFEPYLRLDGADDARRYGDIRELSYTHRWGDWDVLAGFGQVFWGVAESVNVVDIINQTDALEDVDEDEKLGQPMLRLSNRNDFGTFEAYYLPFFREKAFPGREGRLRLNPIIDEDAAEFERGGEEWAGDIALRYTQRFGEFDLGAHVFHGTNRDPLLSLENGVFAPLYQELSQTGIDLQYTEGPWLLKGEQILAETGDESYLAGVLGFEYTLFDIAASGFDLGLIGEYLHDNRETESAPSTAFENDLFIGTRLTWNDVNDTELLAGSIIDVETGSSQSSLEFERRLTPTSALEVEARHFLGSQDPLLKPLRRDTNLTVRYRYFF